MNFKKSLYLLTSIFCSAYLINFLWESLHGFSLYTDHIIDSDRYVWMMVYMSFMDAVTIITMYLVCAFFMKDIMWLMELNKRRIGLFFIMGLIVAIAAEYWAVYLAHEWQYNSKMPLVFGIGLSPLLQLSVTGLLAMWLTNKLIKN